MFQCSKQTNQVPVSKPIVTLKSFGHLDFGH